MHLYLFDFQGTLTSLDNPVAFIRTLRDQEPEAKIVIFSGIPSWAMRKEHGKLADVVDDIWSKAFGLPERLEAQGWPIAKVTIVDDTSFFRQSAERVLLEMGYEVVSLPETALGSLINPPPG